MSTTVERKRVDGRHRIGERCDSCGDPAPRVVGPILYGTMGWDEFALDGSYEGREWDATVLLCPRCTRQMRAFVESGGRAGEGPRPPLIVTSEGGFYAEPEWRS